MSAPKDGPYRSRRPGRRDHRRHPRPPALASTGAHILPGTSTPVAINSVNQNSNSQYSVDNTAGYTTALDGLTKPCRVPVQPGQPVTVKIATADASDSAYDSAVALLDDGIVSEWSARTRADTARIPWRLLTQLET